MIEKVEYVRRHCIKFASVQRTCEMIGISRWTYNANTEEKILERDGRNTKLRDHIEDIQLDFPTYGYRRLQAELARRRIVVNHKKIKLVMKEHGIRTARFRPFVHTTDSNYDYHIYPNLAKVFNLTAISQISVTDISDIRVATCFVYLSAILGRFSPRVVD